MWLACAPGPAVLRGDGGGLYGFAAISSQRCDSCEVARCTATGRARDLSLDAVRRRIESVCLGLVVERHAGLEACLERLQ